MDRRTSGERAQFPREVESAPSVGYYGHMRIAMAVAATLLAVAGSAGAKEPSPSKESAAEMLKALHLLDKSFGLESMPPPHCLKWGYGHLITADEVRACAKQALDK